MEPIFYFDFGSPNAYLAHRLIPGIEARTGAKFAYMPVLLGGLFKLAGNQAPMLTFAGVPNRLAYERREMERFIEKHRLIEFRMNPHFPVNTLALMRCAVAAEGENLLAPYIEAMFHFMWEEPRKLDDMAVLAATLAETGLPSTLLLARAQEPLIKAQLAANTQAAFEQGAFGIPSFIVGGELYFGKDQLREIGDILGGAASTSRNTESR